MEVIASLGIPDVICLCEITKIAATELRDRLFPSYKVISLDVKVDEPTLQVAILHSADDFEIEYSEQKPITVERTARHSRPMAVLDVMAHGNRIRIVACHWQARIDSENSEDQRYRNAEKLSAYCYEFLNEGKKSNHVIIVGDLNEEPYERSLRNLNAHRYRSRAQGRLHWADDDVQRVHLYNASWRHLGEKHAHPHSILAAPMGHSAGTYYWSERKTWHNFDQLIVSGGLLSDGFPHLNEHEFIVVSTPAFLTNGLPEQFSRKGKDYRGLSDHLPLFAKISLQ